MSKSSNLLHKKNLREKAEIEKDMNHCVFQIGTIIGNIHLLHKQKHELLLKVERLSKEQAKVPDKKPDDSPVEEPSSKVEDTIKDA